MKRIGENSGVLLNRLEAVIRPGEREPYQGVPGSPRPRRDAEQPPYPARPGVPNIRQVFVYSDVVTTSAAGAGQLIELQV